MSRKRKNGDAREEERRRRSICVRPREEERVVGNRWGQFAPIFRSRASGRRKEALDRFGCPREEERNIRSLCYGQVP
jgi:hypothetical protein